MPFNYNLAKQIHNNKYDYSHVKFTTCTEKVEIICHIHGIFLQSPHKHINCKRGCPSCGRISARNKIMWSLGQFIEQAIIVHNNRYDYSESVYIGTDRKTTIICKQHGRFLQTPSKHLLNKQGCPKCKGVRISENKRFSTNIFIDHARKIHGNKYDYSDVDYVNSHTHVVIKCPIHGSFLQKPSNHLYIKCACPMCNNNTSRQEKAWLDAFNNDNLVRQKTIRIKNKTYKVDAFDPTTNTIYEFFGIFWHGHPTFFSADEINPRNKIAFGELYKNTLEKIKDIKEAGFNLIYQWG